MSTNAGEGDVLPPTSSAQPPTSHSHSVFSSLPGATFNCRRRLRADATVFGTYMDTHCLSILFLSDTGPIDPSVETALHPRRIFGCGPGPNGRSVAIVVDASLSVKGEPLVDPSGGAIAVDIQADCPAGTRRSLVRLISCYQPTNLDSVKRRSLDPHATSAEYLFDPLRTGTLKGDLLRKEAHRVRRVINSWASSPDVMCTLLGGDMNETVCGPTDRRVGAARQRARSAGYGPINHMLLTDGWTDLYRTLHPAQDQLEMSGEPSCHEGHTCFKSGSSRLDYILIHPRPSDAAIAGAHCAPDYTHELDDGDDHVPVRFSVPLMDVTAWKRGKDWKPWSGPSVHTSGITNVQRDCLMEELNKSVAANAPEWSRRLDSLHPSDPLCEDTIGVVAAAFVDTLVRTGTSVVGGKRGGRRKPYRSPPELTRQRAIRRHLCSLVSALRDSIPWGSTAFSVRAAKARHALVHLKATEVLGPAEHATWNDTKVWSDFLDGSHDSLKVVRRNIKTLVKSTPSHPSNIKDNLFNSPKGRGRFYKRWLRDAGSPTNDVSSARDSLGELHTDPRAYMPLVREAVRAPFSNPKVGPAVPTWRSLSETEKETGVPFWWDSMYSREAKGIPSSTWDGLMSDTDRNYVHAVLREADGEKAPGHDGGSIDLLKIAGGAHLSLAPSGPAAHCLDIMVNLVNASLRTGKCPPFSKKGIVVMVPKPGSKSDDVSDKRPITLLPEIGKLTNRVLVLRFTSVLLLHPGILDRAQRAHLCDGNSRQCLHAVVDSCEDFQSRKRLEADLDLILTSYDVRKAFDTVQRFSIVASCRRLNLPEGFINYVISTLEGAKSQVRTLHGLCKEFDILTSVRQGDPLAALVFNLLMDSLHAGFRNNPLGSRNETPVRGYSPSSPERVEIFSAGYADDTATLTGKWSDTEQQHMWLLDFFVAHHLRLNSLKTYCVVGSGRMVGERFLPDINESLIHDPVNGCPACAERLATPTMLKSKDIATRPPSFAFRYLGLMLRVDLCPDDMISVISARVWETAVKIRTHSLDLVQAGDVIREYLYPKIELGLIFARVTRSTFRGWDSVIRSSILRSRMGSNVASVCSEAMMLALNLQPLEDYAAIVSVTELGYTLRLSGVDSSATGWGRIDGALRARKIRTSTIIVNGASWSIITASVNSSTNRATRIIKEGLRLGIHMSWRLGAHMGQDDTWPTVPVDSSYLLKFPVDPRVGCPVMPSCLAASQTHLRYVCMPSGQCPPVAVFTDASYAESKSGYCAVLCNRSALQDPDFVFSEKTCAVLLGGASRSGMNFNGECVGILAALHAVPPTVSLECYSDALSAIQTVTAPPRSQSARFRLGARPVVRAILALIRLRRMLGASTVFRHVRSHTENTDVVSRGNAFADIGAGRAANDERNVPMMDSPFLANEERLVFWEAKGDNICDNSIELKHRLWHESGDIRKKLKSIVMARLLQGLRRRKAQGHVARQDGRGLTGMFDRVRKLRDARLLQFLLLASTQQTATADKLVWPASARTEQVMRCPHCLRKPQNVMHTLQCPVVRSHIRGVRRAVEVSLTRMCNGLRAAPGLSHHHRSLAARDIPALRWYDVTRPPSCSDYPGHSCPDKRLASLMSKVDGYDRLAGALGIIPSTLRALVAPDPAAMGARECTHKSLRRSALLSLNHLSLEILRASHAAYKRWLVHPVSPAKPPAQPGAPTRKRIVYNLPSARLLGCQ